MAMFHMSNDSGLFRTREELEAGGWKLEGNVFHQYGKRYLPLYEGRMIQHFDHRAASVGTAEENAFRSGTTLETGLDDHKNPAYVVQPRYWVRLSVAEGANPRGYSHNFYLGYKDISSATNERTFVSAVIPRTAVGNKVPLILPSRTATEIALLSANLSSYVFDYVVRQKMGSVTLNFFIAKQLPVLPPNTYDVLASWNENEFLRDWLTPRVLELTYTAWDLQPFARDLGYDGPPFRWDPERRFLLRCELDAAYFHLYGIGRDDAAYIMETFHIVKRKDEATHGEYRTRRVILEIYDAMQRATETGHPYRTPLDPPPVDLGTSEAGSATVTPLRPRPEPQPERAPTLPQAAEERHEYAPDPPVHETPEPDQQTDAAKPAPQQATRSPNGASQPQPPDDQTEALAGDPAPEAPNLYEAALALNACLPDGQRIEREPLLQDAAHELGYEKLTKKVRRALNKALNAEHNAGRLKTDWEHVWKPRKK